MSLDFTLIDNGESVYDFNITSNLGSMARACGLYDCLWLAAEHGVARAADLIPALEKGITELALNVEKYASMNPPNGWGSWENLLSCAVQTLAACKRWPGATIDCWR